MGLYPLAQSGFMEEILIDLTRDENPGVLADICQDLALAGVNILNVAATVCLRDQTGEELHGAAIAIITDDTQAAFDVLFYDGMEGDRPSRRPFECMAVRQVRTATIPNQRGSLADLARKISDEGHNITSMYVLTLWPVRSGQDVEIGFTTDSDGDITGNYKNQ